MTIVDALQALLPGVEWVLQGSDLSGLTIVTPNIKPPTKDQINTWLAANAYTQLRAKEYPPIGDQLDAIWKGGTDMDAMRAQIQAVKAKYPAPVTPAATTKGA